MLAKIKNKLNKDIHLKELLTGSAVTFILKITGMILGYVVILIISRKYGAEGVGIYNLSLSLMTFLAMVSSMGLNISILRYVGQFNKKEEKYKLKLLFRYALEIVVPFSIMVAISSYLLSGFVANNVFKNPAYEIALKLGLIIIPFLALLNISVEYIRGLKLLKISEFLRSVSRPLINILLLLILGMFIYSKLLPLYTLAVAIIISSLIGLIFILRKIKSVRIIEKSDFTKKELLLTSLPMMVTVICSSIITNASLYILGHFASSADVGVYSISFKLALFMSLIFVVTNTITAPNISKFYWDNKIQELNKVLQMASKLNILISLVGIVIFILFGKLILEVFGKDFIKGYIALIILSFGHLINSEFGLAKVVLNMIGEHKVTTIITIIVMIISIVTGIIFVPLYGIEGAALSFMISMMSLNIIATIYLRRKFNITSYYVPYVFKKKGE